MLPRGESKSIEQWLTEYSESHQNPINKLIHWICVPGIFLTVVGFLWAIPKPGLLDGIWGVNWASVALAFVVVFYLRLSWRIAVGIVLFSLGCMGLVAWYEALELWGLWQSSAVLFVVFWVMQFVGHSIEGKKPSFVQDLQFLLIGPAWVIGFIYRKLGWRY